MSAAMVLERRAATVLHNYLHSVARPGTWLLPANICPIVPAVFSKARRAYEFVDVQRDTLCIDIAAVLRRLSESPTRHAGVLFVRTYGHIGNFEPFFRRIKAIDDDLRIIDDRCAARPCFAHSEGVADLELYSSGYSKFVDLGWGGWGLLRDGKGYEADPISFEPLAHENLVKLFRKVQAEGGFFVCPETPWLDTRKVETEVKEFRDAIESRMEKTGQHRAQLNDIYFEHLHEWVIPSHCGDWRFSFVCDNQQEILRRIFAAGHFASAHYASLVPSFGTGDAPVAQKFARRIVNLFNDFRYDAKRAAQLAKFVREQLKNMNAVPQTILS